MVTYVASKQYCQPIKSKCMYYPTHFILYSYNKALNHSPEHPLLHRFFPRWSKEISQGIENVCGNKVTKTAKLVVYVNDFRKIKKLASEPVFEPTCEPARSPSS